MKAGRQIVFDYLSDMNISYRLVEHPAVHTIEEMDKVSLDNSDQIVKNLFVRDDKKRRYFIVVLQKDKRVNLKKLRVELKSRPLSFASERSLHDVLGLSKGSVTPFGILNDSECEVEVVFDQDIRDFDQIGVHPNDNTATIWLKPEDMEAVVRKHGNEFSYVEI